MDCDNPQNDTAIVECLREKSTKEIMDAFSEHSVKYFKLGQTKNSKLKAITTHQAEEMLRGKTGFGGTIPCAQTAGVRKFYEEFQNPVDILLNGEYNHVPIFFGAYSHEGSFIYQGND